MLELYIGNKNYSSWSMRTWVLMRHFEIDFVEKHVRFDSFAKDSQFKKTMAAISPAARVPVLIDDGLVIWDTLAIAEYLAEKYPHLPIWPEKREARARARSLSAQMHSGFASLRKACQTNIEADLSHIGALVWRDNAAAREDLALIENLWQTALAESGGPFLLGEFSAVDSFFAPVCTRLLTYGLPVSDVSRQYIDRMCQTPAVNEWVTLAKAEHDFRAFEEPHRLER